MSPLRELHAVLASPARRTLLELLRGRVESQGAADLAEATGLHVTTVRHHVEGLQQAGLVVGGLESRGGVGRPRRVFTAAIRHPMKVRAPRHDGQLRAAVPAAGPPPGEQC